MRYLSTVSHELRTPLTSIVSFAELIRSESCELDAGRRRVPGHHPAQRRAAAAAWSATCSISAAWRRAWPGWTWPPVSVPIRDPRVGPDGLGDRRGGRRSSLDIVRPGRAGGAGRRRPDPAGPGQPHLQRGEVLGRRRPGRGAGHPRRPGVADRRGRHWHRHPGRRGRPSVRPVLPGLERARDARCRAPGWACPRPRPSPSCTAAGSRWPARWAPGTTFTVYLPIAAMTASRGGAGDRGRPGHRAGHQGRAGGRRPGGADRRRRPVRAARLPRRPPGLVVLDVGLPVLDGWAVLDRIRELSDVPVLMLTSHGLEAEKVRGLRAGADDYRHQAVQQRRAAGPGPGAAAPGPARPGRAGACAEDLRGRRCCRMAFATARSAWPTAPVSLTPTEFRLLAVLVRHPDQVLSPGAAARPGLAGPGRDRPGPGQVHRHAAAPQARPVRRQRTAASRPCAASATATCPRR